MTLFEAFFSDWYEFSFPSSMLERADLLEPLWEKFIKEAELGEQMVLRANVSTKRFLI